MAGSTFYTERCLLDVSFDLAFPDTDDTPASLGQKLVVATVSCAIGVDLLAPALCIGSLEGSRRVNGATVPVTAVDEDSQVPAGEHEVGSAPSHKTAMEPEAEAQGMHRLTELQLRLGVLGLSGS